MRHHHHRARRSRIRHGFPRLLTLLSLSPGGGGVIAAGTPPDPPAVRRACRRDTPPDTRTHLTVGTTGNRGSRPAGQTDPHCPLHAEPRRTGSGGRRPRRRGARPPAHRRPELPNREPPPPYPGANDLRRTSNRGVRACGRQPTKTATADTAGPLRGAYDSLQSL